MVVFSLVVLVFRLGGVGGLGVVVMVFFWVVVVFIWVVEVFSGGGLV